MEKLIEEKKNELADLKTWKKVLAGEKAAKRDAKALEK
jgi:hypothetical protein